MAIKNRLFRNETKSLGVSNSICCPVCGKNTGMALFDSTDSINYIAMVQGKDTQTGIAVCPLCATAFYVDRNYMKSTTTGFQIELRVEDLVKVGREK